MGSVFLGLSPSVAVAPVPPAVDVALAGGGQQASGGRKRVAARPKAAFARSAAAAGQDQAGQEGQNGIECTPPSAKKVGRPVRNLPIVVDDKASKIKLTDLFALRRRHFSPLLLVAKHLQH